MLSMLSVGGTISLCRRHAPDPSGYGDTLYNMGQGVSFVTSKFSAAGLDPIVRQIKVRGKRPRCYAEFRDSDTIPCGCVGGYSIIQLRS